jgi:hypothetical protein
MASGTDGSMWGPLLEKAYAKFIGHYDSIVNGGSASEFIRTLTGMPGFTYVTKKTDNPIKIIAEAIRKGDIVTCGTLLNQTLSKRALGQVGENFLKSYSILDSIIVNDAKNNVAETFLYLRNPTGKELLFE